MERKFFCTVVLSLALISCSGQTLKDSKSTVDNGKPQSHIKVNKEYDQNGNIIGYDSTYTYSYSNAGKYGQVADSIFNNFRSSFNRKFSFSDEPFFKDYFLNDSTLMHDFNQKDYFLKLFKDNMDKMDSLFLKMDMFKNNFFGNQYDFPGHPLIVPKK